MIESASQGLVYVSGPYTKGNPLEHVRRAIIVTGWYRQKGWAVALPHLSIQWEIMFPLSWEEWLAQDLVLVERCDRVIRLPGVSQGADLEVAHAKKLGIEVHYLSPEEMTEIGKEIMGTALDYIPNSQRSLPASHGRPGRAARSQT